MFNGKKKGEPVSEKAAGMVARCIHRIQKRSADWLGKKTADFGRGGKAGILIIVCFVFGGFSVLSIVDVFTAPAGGQSLKPDQVRVPAYYDNPGDSSVNDVTIISPSAYYKMRAFRRYMDSLRQSSSGKLLYDSIMKNRPGLMDSVLLLEEIYHSQQNGTYGK